MIPNFPHQNFSKMQYEGKVYGKVRGKYIQLKTWNPASTLPPQNKDVIAVLTDGTFLMARHSRLLGWAFYFSDTGLQFDDIVARNVTNWLPLTALPPIPA